MTQEPIQNIVETFLKETPYGADKIAEGDVQFNIDPSFGLSRKKFGWHSNDVLFDSTFFTEGNGQIEVETSATTQDVARIRSAFPGQYISHTLAEPGMGLQIPEEHIERGDDNLTSLTHGEISAEIVEWDDSTDSGKNAHGLSFESDGIFVQVRKNDSNVEFVSQENWNIDPLDGTGPSGKILKPENGLIYNFPYTWYGYGSLFVAIQDTKTSDMIPVHRVKIDSQTSLGTPNMPVQLTIENKDTADPLGANLGGMQFVTYGSASLEQRERGRTTEAVRHTGTGYIDQNVTLTTDDAVDPFAEPGRPLVSVRRDTDELNSRVALSVNITNAFINSGGDVYLFVFDEYDTANALTGENFVEPATRNLDAESRLEIDTASTEYNPGANAVLRGLLYVSGDKNTAEVITGDSSQRLPIDATSILTAALPPGANTTYAQPIILEAREGF